MWYELSVATHRRTEAVEITGQLAEVIARSGVRDGVATVYCPHTTAGLTINENADPDVMDDLMRFLDALIERANPGFRHREGNADGHVKASLVGASVSFPVRDGRPALGRWQGVFLCEFDGPRRRQVSVRVAGVLE
ncbi:secondary thiamine-phosphate synthase enzyme YjbQ [Carboxydochorda subterranea]|uniref:Secondary thiamine-phosphate synthase enzyme YjbQ n=1 Tax=Carboxydichorda subterranea TaxID=3109565 RepID=A0ABZ1C109_9FIRM|nr:secondary thiamine-phosphate synthase enzyme YjbQ [Limnochorda sp. L945t]WRP18789.1 secondary thiamine-phosphate synthase enzyme YjbQ [Limnochorda sp. L945t]